MKNKVITFNGSGKIVEKNLDLTQVNENVFYYIENSEYPNLISVVVKHNEILIDVAYMNICLLEGRMERLNDYALNYQQRVIEKEKPLGVDIYVFQKLGYDTIIIDNNNNATFEKQEQVRQAKIEKEKIEKEEKIALQKLNAENALAHLKNGGNISFVSLEEIIEIKKIKIHPRTLGAIRKLGNRVINQKQGEFLKTTSQSTVNSIFEIINLLLKQD